MVQYEQPHSYVWPPDYNWMNNNGASNVSQNHYPVTSTEMLVPWLLSVWMMGKAPDDWSNKSKPPKKSNKGFRNEYVGFKDRFTWGQIDLEYPNQESKRMARKSGAFIPANNLPLGIEVWKDKMFLSIPQWKKGIPVTLTSVDLNSNSSSPRLKPFPDWNWYTTADTDPCRGLVSVFRMQVDKCDRLWVLDTGSIDLAKSVNQICPTKLDVFNLKTNRHVRRFIFPSAQVSKDSLFTNIVVEIINDNCEDAFAYMSDVFQYGLVVYNYKMDVSRRIFHPYFYPDPLHCRYHLDNITFHWVDGIFGMSLSPESKNRVLYFHAMSSNHEFYVPTSSLRNGTLGSDILDHFVSFNDSRCHKHELCQTSASAMDTKGVMYYNVVTTAKIGCWNSRHEFKPSTQGVLDSGPVQLSFPNDLKVDQEPVQRIWMISNGLHKYLYNKMNPNEINVRVMMAYTDVVTRGTVCDSR
ncbi:protein yellow-like [Adelges cooleyi]|uniref:protein yellow-like n=1 Tax=Adelges cooleyi TaxID=133065 RepID=UPI00217F9186|nr:protein yellow-like [Adelges cooleyi]